MVGHIFVTKKMDEIIPTTKEKTMLFYYKVGAHTLDEVIYI